MSFAQRFRAVITLSTIISAALLVWTLMSMPTVTVTGLQWIVLVAYFLLLAVAQTFPVKIREHSFVLLMGIEIPLFLQFGPIIALVAVNLSWLVSQLMQNKQIRIQQALAVVNVYTLTILISYAAFLGAGGNFRIADLASPKQLTFPLTLFLLATLLINELLPFFNMLLFGKWRRWVSDAKALLAGPVVETMTAVVFVFLWNIYGLMAYLYIIPVFAVLLYVLRLYSEMSYMNERLKVVNEVTTQISSEFHEDALLQALANGAVRLFDVTNCFVFLLNENEHVLTPAAVRGPSEAVEEVMRKVRIKVGECVVGYAFMMRQTVLQKHPERRLSEAGRQGQVALLGASVLAVPLMQQDLVIGVVALTAPENNKFSKKDQDLIEILANHGAIAISNLRRFTMTHERNFLDELTGLYNYRYFEKNFSELCETCDREHHGLVVLVLDLDHFKHINDTYGHLSGNEVLKKVARVLKEQVRDMDVVCRYGGEEFTVVLPRANLETGRQIAERLRIVIENTAIPLPGDGQVIPLPIHVTVSVGVASYPEMGETPMDVLRHADRALYVGSKQKGRNRVAIYEG